MKTRLMFAALLAAVAMMFVAGSVMAVAPATVKQGTPPITMARDSLQGCPAGSAYNPNTRVLECLLPPAQIASADAKAVGVAQSAPPDCPPTSAIDLALSGILPECPRRLATNATVTAERPTLAALSYEIAMGQTQAATSAAGASRSAGLAQIVPNRIQELAAVCGTGESSDPMALPLTCLSQPAAAQVKNFSGSFLGAEIDNPIFPTMTVDGKVTGEATHLGRFTYHYNAIVDMTTGKAPETAQFIAANGDVVYVEGHRIGDNEGNPPFSATITEMMTITGGTGRFEGVSGSYTIHRTATAPSSWTTTQGTFEGTFVMPKGK